MTVCEQRGETRRSGAGKEIEGTEEEVLYRSARYFPTNERVLGTDSKPLSAPPREDGSRRPPASS